MTELTTLPEEDLVEILNTSGKILSTSTTGLTSNISASSASTKIFQSKEEEQQSTIDKRIPTPVVFPRYRETDQLSLITENGTNNHKYDSGCGTFEPTSQNSFSTRNSFLDLPPPFRYWDWRPSSRANLSDGRRTTTDSNKSMNKTGLTNSISNPMTRPKNAATRVRSLVSVPEIDKRSLKREKSLLNTNHLPKFLLTGCLSMQ